MSASEVSASEVGAVNAYARADSLAAIPVVRSPIRPRFELADAPTARRVPDRPPQSGGPGLGTAAPERETTPAVAGPRTSTGPVSAFLAQAIAQESSDDRPPVSAFQIGTAAYGSPPPEGPGSSADGVDVLAPFPRLASGRSLDLSV